MTVYVLLSSEHITANELNILVCCHCPPFSFKSSLLKLFAVGKRFFIQTNSKLKDSCIPAADAAVAGCFYISLVHLTGVLAAAVHSSLHEEIADRC